MEDFFINLGLEPLSAKIVGMTLAALVIWVIFATIAGFLSYAERRVAGLMQSRLGPNRVGPHGILQWVADGVKLILKEDLTPDGADRVLFRLAPYLCLAGVFGTMVVFPWGNDFIPADLNVGVFYLISITSLVVIGILMAGWSSNNKWALLGGMRSAAQIISYEIPVAMGLLTPILMAGALSMKELMAVQGWLPWEWTLFQSPFAIISFLVFFIGSLAEGNRAPFDLPEAESELVAGYCTEYSGFRFGVFFLSEFANIFVIGGATVAVYLGGGNLPSLLEGVFGLSALLFVLKTFIIVFVIIWLRWTLPRFRIDQLMTFSWKYLLPAAFIAFFGQAVYMLIVRELPVVSQITASAMFLIFLFALYKFIVRVVVNRREQAWKKKRGNQEFQAEKITG